MKKTLYIVLSIHVFILLFQLSFRQLFLDTTFIRDIGIFILCAIYITRDKKNTNIKDSLGGIVNIYLWYGVLMSIFHLLDGIPFLGVIADYRNHFFPFVLFFVSLYILQDIKYRKKWVDLLYWVFIIMLVDIYIEKAMDIAGISRVSLPWYQYQMAHYYRFTELETGSRMLANPETIPILGLLGWNNVTACGLTALFSFFVPFLLQKGIHEKGMPRVARLSKIQKIVLLVATIAALIILEIKTPFAALVVVFFIYMLQTGKRDLIRTIVPIVIIGCLVAYFTFSLWQDIFQELFEETTGEYGFSYIFDQNVIGALLSAAFSDSPLAFLFGTDITNNSMFDLLEVRLIVHTIQFGVLWLITYSLVYIFAFKAYNKTKKIRLQPFDKLLAMGSMLLIVSYVVDFLHYAHVMFLFHIDIFVVTLAVLVSVRQRGVIYES